MTKASRDTQKKKEEGRGREEKDRTQVFPATRKHPGGIPECYIQECTKKRKREEGEGRGGRGLRSRQVPTNLKSTLTAAVTLCPAKVAGCFDRCGHVKA